MKPLHGAPDDCVARHRNVALQLIPLLIGLALFTLSSNTPVVASGNDAITITADTPWVVAKDEPEAVQRALTDVQADWYKVFGHRPVILSEPPQTWKGPVVYLGTKGPWLKQLTNDLPRSRESFVLKAQSGAGGNRILLATGADTRGAVYAAYALSEEILGVDPWYFWTDHQPTQRRHIEVPATLNKTFGAPTFRFRGWFINDEDLLGSFTPDPLRENVFSLEMLDRICETILRLRGNMIVPGTFNFADERCWELAARRGLALNMHHILVAGLNTYRWPKDVPFSYSKHPDIMERYWRACIDAYKDYEVVWTVGYRGKHDRPFWQDEPELNTAEARGAVITKAISKQVELIRQKHPDAAIIANLWAEGADLMQAGHLKLPAGVIQVWPDDGSGMIRDNGAVKTSQGTYYHTTMLSGRHNQLSEMVPPERIYSELGRFARAGATNFFLVNVSDVRPVPLSTDCAMKFVWNAQPFLEKSPGENMSAFLADWSQRQFGVELAQAIASIYDRYFNVSYHRDKREGDNSLNTAIRNLERRFLPALQGGKPPSRDLLAKARSAKTSAESDRLYVTELARSAEKLSQRVPSDRKAFYQAHVVTPIRLHLHLLEMLQLYAETVLAYNAGQKPEAIAHVEKALQASENLFAALHKAETGKWSCFYIGERFVGLESRRDSLRVLLATLRGEPPPPTRPALNYPELYQYQEPFEKNFPLLYPASRSN